MGRASRMTLDLFLVRHGQTEWSVSRQYTGRSDIPLNRARRGRGRRPGPLAGRHCIDRVFTSPLQRAQRTCALAGFGAGAEIEPALAQWDYGEYEGKRSTAIHNDHPRWTIFRMDVPVARCQRISYYVPTSSSLVSGGCRAGSHCFPMGISGRRWRRDG
jgi:broad specificity phosphatase PhoE